MDKKIKKLLLELFNLSVHVSETTKYHIHYEYSGTLNYVNIFYFKNESEFKDIVEILNIYINSKKGVAAIEELLLAKDKLLGFITGGDLIEEII